MKTILHIVEPLATGIHSFLVDLTDHQCDDYDVYIAYGVRPQTHKNFKSYFNEKICWIKVENFHNSIGFKDIKAFFELRKILNEVNPDIVHLHSSKAGFLGRWVCNCSKNKVFYTPHGFSFLMQDGTKLKKMFYWITEYFSAKCNKAITIACSEGEYKEALNLSKRCAYVNNGINLYGLDSYLNKVNKTESLQPVVCTSGRILTQKNPVLFNQIASQLPDVRFIWIGEGELRNELKSPNIEITGWVDRETALELTNNSDFFILPSLWEGLPISLLEAMYLKKICLVSDVIGNRDVIDNERNGFICKSVDEYILNITQMLHDKNKRLEIAEQAHNDVSILYNATIMSDKYNEIYNNS